LESFDVTQYSFIRDLFAALLSVHSEAEMSELHQQRLPRLFLIAQTETGRRQIVKILSSEMKHVRKKKERKRGRKKEVIFLLLHSETCCDITSRIFPCDG
jgi:hypothetical protein